MKHFYLAGSFLFKYFILFLCTLMFGHECRVLLKLELQIDISCLTGTGN